MILLLVSLAVIGGLTWYMTEPWERVQAVTVIRRQIQEICRRVIRSRRAPTALDPVLRARTRILLVTPVLALLHVAVFLGVMGSAAPADDPMRLLSWGASLGTRTTNGEWWRLLTASFVHASAWGLVVNLAALIAVGRVMERIAGPVAFLSTFLGTSLVAAVAGLALNPVTVTGGASAGICGLYGLLIATWMWGAVQRSETTVRIGSVARLAPFTIGFVVYHTWGTGVFAVPEQLAAGTGFAAGIFLCQRASEGWAPLRRVAITAAASLCLAASAAVPLRGIADVEPELARLADLEAEHTTAYDELISLVTRGRAPRAEAVTLIERRILPQLAAARTRLAGLERVPKAHAPLLESARVYLDLRERSWTLRADGNRQSRSATLREADQHEQAARAVLRGLTD
jgi:membrane associated rhomboid family serine protease